LANYEQSTFRNQILELGKLEIVEVKGKNSYGVDVVRDKYSKMKFNAYESDVLNRKIKDIFDKAKVEADKKQGDDTKNKEKEAKQDAIREVEEALNEYGLN